MFVCLIDACHVSGEPSLVTAHRVQGVSGSPLWRKGHHSLSRGHRRSEVCALRQGLREAQHVCSFERMWKRDQRGQEEVPDCDRLLRWVAVSVLSQWGHRAGDKATGRLVVSKESWVGSHCLEATLRNLGFIPQGTYLVYPRGILEAGS